MQARVSRFPSRDPRGAVVRRDTSNNKAGSDRFAWRQSAAPATGGRSTPRGVLPLAPQGRKGRSPLVRRPGGGADAQQPKRCWIQPGSQEGLLRLSFSAASLSQRLQVHLLDVLDGTVSLHAPPSSRRPCVLHSSHLPAAAAV